MPMFIIHMLAHSQARLSLEFIAGVKSQKCFRAEEQRGVPRGAADAQDHTNRRPRLLPRGRGRQAGKDISHDAAGHQGPAAARPEDPRQGRISSARPRPGMFPSILFDQSKSVQFTNMRWISEFIDNFAKT